MSIYERTLEIGGDSGDPFEKIAAYGKVLTKIAVYRGPWQIRGLQVWMTGDDKPTTFGTAEGRAEYFEFKPGERITNMFLTGNGEGTRTGWIEFKTSTGRSFSWGMERGPRTPYSIDVGSGICVGVKGKAGGDIDALAFVFLKPIAHAVIEEMRYPTLQFDTPSVAPVSLETFRKVNTGQQARDYDFHGGREEETSESWSTTLGLEAYMEVAVSAEVPEVVSVENRFGWKLSASATHTLTETHKQSLSWSISGTLKPGESVSLAAITRRGTLSIPYRGRMRVTLKNGEIFQYDVSGTYTGVAYTGVEIVDTGTAVALGALSPEEAEAEPLEAVLA